jgi:uncharacterized membrane protein YeaQ/YmgE (transglycosylase-associated protein family)
MGFLIFLVVGGIVGWLASIYMKTDPRQGLFLNVVVGVIGAYIGGLLISPLVGIPAVNPGTIGLASVLVSFAGAIILLALVNFFKRNRSQAH